MIPKRYLLIVGTFLLSMLLYVDRACISAAKETICDPDELGLSDTQWGWIMAAFSLGYALCQTPAGALADRLGPRRVLASVVAFWSLFTALTGAAWNFTSMLVARLLFGAGEAVAFPGCARAFYSWLPVSERGLAQGINFSGSRLGAALALPLIAWMIEVLGWRESFYVLGGVGFAWALFWFYWFRDEPTDHPSISDEERELILTGRQQPREEDADAPKLTAETVIGSRNMWLAMGQYICSNFTFFFAISWSLPHLKTSYGLEGFEAGVYAGIPLLCGALGNWVSGYMVDAIYRRGAWKRSRQIPAIVGFLLATGGMMAILRAESAAAYCLFLSIAIFGADMTLSPSWAFCIDIGRRNAGAVSGTMNMAGNIGAMVTSLAFAYLQEWTDSTTPFFLIAALLNLMAVAAWLAARPDRPLEEW